MSESGVFEKRCVEAGMSSQILVFILDFADPTPSPIQPPALCHLNDGCSLNLFSEDRDKGLRTKGGQASSWFFRRVKSTPGPDTPPISIAMLLQKYALLLAESSIHITNLYHDTAPICIAILFQKY